MADANCTRACTKCGAEFEVTHGNQKRCPRHRAKSSYFKKPVRKKPCESCGSTFRYKSATARFCCEGCARGWGKPLHTRSRGCADCGTQFVLGNPNQRLCDGCRFIEGEQIECARCGEAFLAKNKPRGGRKQRYCTGACAAGDMARKRQARKYTGRHSRIWWVFCKCCGDLRGHHRNSRGMTCGSDECRAEYFRAHNWCRANGVLMSFRVYRRAKAPRSCSVCSSVYQPAHASKCNRCPVCINKTPTGSGRSFDKEHPMTAGVNPLSVLRADGWQCYICGVKTPAKFRGTQNKRAPQVDHITPVALGGAHEFENLACACLKCNAEKRDRVLYSLSLMREVESRKDIVDGDTYVIRWEYKTDNGAVGLRCWDIGWDDGKTRTAA